MTMTAWRQAEGCKSVQWTNPIRILHTQISGPNATQRRPSVPGGFDSDQDHHDHDGSPAEPSISTLDIDDPWGKKSILSLDGGGVRTFSSLLILRELMREVGEHERRENSEASSSAYSPLVDCMLDEESVLDYLPCHYFDYISGTSTGGLIAIMLGRLRRSVDEVIEAYKELGAKVLGKPVPQWKRFLINHDNIARRESLKNSLPLARLPSPQEQADQFKSDRARCRTIVCSVKSNENKDFQTPFLFRSYDRKSSCTSYTSFGRNPSDPNSFEIWQVAQATSAAPSSLKAVHTSETRYYDGATVLNNPSWEVVKEVSLLTKESHNDIDLLLSIGGGNAKGNNPRLRFGTGSLLQELTDISDVVHDKVKSESKIQGFTYFRFDVKEGLQTVRMNEWKPKSGGGSTFAKIETATKNYLKQESVRSSIRRCAQLLVNKRTQRAQTMRWERFAIGACYRCPLADGCPTPKAIFDTRNDLMDHLRSKHNEAPPDAEHYQHIHRLLDRGRLNSKS